jgi:hypothetical protein
VVPRTTLVLRNVVLVQVAQRHTAPVEPAIEGQRVPGSDVYNIDRVLLADQPDNVSVETSRQRTNGAAN